MTALKSLRMPNFGLVFLLLLGTILALVILASPGTAQGAHPNDSIGNGGATNVIALTNGNFVVQSPNWDDGGTTNVGAVTFGSGTIGVSGVVSSSNSLIGSTANDQVGIEVVTALTNGNYVVASPVWDDGGTANVGAATLVNGSGVNAGKAVAEQILKLARA